MNVPRIHAERSRFRPARRALRVSIASLFLSSFPAVTATVSAQSWFVDPPARYVVGVNVTGQIADGDFSDETAFPLYDETAVFGAAYDLGSSAGVELSGGVYVWNNVGIGLAYARFGGGGDARLVASLPHPVRFDQPRLAEATAETDHAEHAVHLHALWTVPVPNMRRLDVTVALGPSFYRVRQDIVTGITHRERGDPFTEVDITGLTIDSQSDGAVGFNVAADAVYMLSPRLGGGVTLRFSRATAEFSGGRDVRVDAGGVQVGAGIRVRF
jgi:hypothetical protein